MAEVDAALVPVCSPVDAELIAERFVKSFPKRSVTDAETYIKQWVVVLSSYPLHVSKTVSHPMMGLLAKSKFLPTIAELKEYLDETLTAHMATRNKAQAVLLAHEQRDENKRWQDEQDKTTPEQRKATVKRAMKLMRAKPIPHEKKRYSREAEINKAHKNATEYPERKAKHE